MDTQEQLWIVGHGMITTYRQFRTDIQRARRMTINGRHLPPDVYAAVLILYETCGIRYYQYTKYMNQTMGNLIMFRLLQIYGDMILVPDSRSYTISACYTPVEQSIVSTLTVNVYDTLMRVHITMLSSCKLNLHDDNITIHISHLVYKNIYTPSL